MNHVERAEWATALRPKIADANLLAAFVHQLMDKIRRQYVVIYSCVESN